MKIFYAFQWVVRLDSAVYGSKLKRLLGKESSGLGSSDADKIVVKHFY